MDTYINLQQYLGHEMQCKCGQNHSTLLKEIVIEDGAVTRLPECIKKFGYKYVFVVCDVNTWEAAGKRVVRELEQSQIAYDSFVFDSLELIPNEEAVGKIIEAYEKKTDLILAVGSGTLNDLCKYISFQLGLDYMIFATAPSMDGFVSVGAALINNHVKTTYPAHVPVAVFGDTEILSQAPMEMIVAGLGDILGKYTCLLDWKMAHIIEGEYYCETINNMVKHSIEIVVKEGSLIKTRNRTAIKHLMEALVLTGVAMSFIGNSRPASGSEHHLSHYWEMQFEMDGKKPILHGIKVGIGMIAIVKMYQMLAEQTIDFNEAAKVEFDEESWKDKVKVCYKDAAPGIIALEAKCQKNNIEKRNKRLKIMEEHWQEIQNLIHEELPMLSDVEQLMIFLGEPINPMQIGVPLKMVEDAVIMAKEVRNRYTILQMLWDLGILEEYAAEIVKYFAFNQVKSHNSLSQNVK